MPTDNALNQRIVWLYTLIKWFTVWRRGKNRAKKRPWQRNNQRIKPSPLAALAIPRIVVFDATEQ